MKLYNQYTDDIRRYCEENGTDIFKEYKDRNTREERKKEIEDWLFHLVREKNEIPQVQLSNEQKYRMFAQLSDVDSKTVYHDNAFWFNNSGITALNTFFPEMFDVEKDGMPSVKDFFQDDYKLRRWVKKVLLMSSSELGMTGMFFICGAGWCSNFRPATAKAIYELFGKKKDCKVLDTSSGYGARLMGAHFAKNVSEYVGIDPNTKKHCDDEIMFLDNWCHVENKKETVLKMGSEDFTAESFPQYQNYFDLYFTSPPYFNTERYSKDSTQSYKKFPTYKKWVTGFYQETIHNACDALSPDGVFMLNIFEKVPNIKELTKLFLADNGWYVVRTDKYMMRSVPGAINDENGNRVKRDTSIGNNFEPIWTARHYSYLYEKGIIQKSDRDRYYKRAIKDNKRDLI